MEDAFIRDGDEGVVVSPAIKVQRACHLFGTKEDEGLAYNLQSEEFTRKYDWNREVRKIARKDVPLARATYDEEEERLQRERLEFLQNQSRLIGEDAELAKQFQREEMLAKERERLRVEAIDQEIAKRIQETEIQKLRPSDLNETATGVRDSASAADADANGRFDITASHSGPPYLNSYVGFFWPREDGGLTEEEERKELILLQDEELALALQEFEHLRALREERNLMKSQSNRNDEQHLPQQPQTTELYAMPLHHRNNSQHQMSRVQNNEAVVRNSIVESNLSSSTSIPNQQLSRDVLPMSSPNQVSDRSVTLVTSVGQSEFYTNLGAPGSGASPVSKNKSSISRSSRKIPNSKR